MSWYVATREDTGDFYLVVREPGGRKNVLEKDIVYKERSYKIRDLPDPDTKYELCVLARDSVGNVKHFRNSQCRILDKHAFNSGHGQSTINILFVLAPIVFSMLL